MNKVIKLIYLVLLVQVVALVVVVSGFNKSTTSSDINKDGAVDALDLSLVLDGWTDNKTQPQWKVD